MPARSGNIDMEELTKALAEAMRSSSNDNSKKIKLATLTGIDTFFCGYARWRLPMVQHHH